MHARAKEIEQAQRSHKARLTRSLSALGALAAAILLVVFLPKVPFAHTDPSGASHAGASYDGMQGSMLAGSGALGYILIALIAFLLGVCVTVFCFRLKERQAEKGGVRSPEKNGTRSPEGKTQENDQ